PVERHVFHGGSVDHLTDRGGSGVDQRRGGGNGQLLPHGSDLEPRVEHQALCHLQFDVACSEGFKSGHGDGHRVASGGQGGDRILAGTVGGGGTRDSGGHVPGLHIRPNHHGAGSVLHGADQGGARDLSAGGRRGQD